MRLTKQLLFIIITCLSYPLLACDCGDIGKIEDYKYIALVEIIAITESDLYQPNTDESQPPTMPFYEIQIKTIKQFVGDKENRILVQGGSTHLPQIGETSCDHYIDHGEEWILFGNHTKDGVKVGFCTPTMFYANSQKEVRYYFNRGGKMLKKLYDKFYPDLGYKQNGPHQEYYDNGQLRLRECYKNNQLQDERIAYYANGNIMLEEYYVDNKKHGFCTWYHLNGYLKREGEYKNGEQICQHREYNSDGTLYKIDYFDEVGNWLKTDLAN